MNSCQKATPVRVDSKDYATMKSITSNSGAALEKTPRTISSHSVRHATSVSTGFEGLRFDLQYVLCASATDQRCSNSHQLAL
jgi:hypothetical protein